MSAMRRDTLRRLVESGRVELVHSYHFDDGCGTTGHEGGPIPCAIAPEDWHECKEGVCYLRPSEFVGACGRVWENANGTFTLYVHSNCNYDLRVKEAERRATILTGGRATIPPGVASSSPKAAGHPL